MIRYYTLTFTYSISIDRIGSGIIIAYALSRIFYPSVHNKTSPTLFKFSLKLLQSNHSKTLLLSNPDKDAIHDLIHLVLISMAKIGTSGQ